MGAVDRFDAVLRRKAMETSDAIFIAESGINVFAQHPTQLAWFVQFANIPPKVLYDGLITWIKKLLPLNVREAEGLAQVEESLRAAFESVPEAALAIDLFEAVRTSALGDTKALLKLPRELRELVDAENGDEETMKSRPRN
jgi:hypothetical protein